MRQGTAIVATVMPDASEWVEVSIFGVTVRARDLSAGEEARFVAADVCRAAGYNAKNVSQFIPAEERGSMEVRTPGGPQLMVTVNRAGMFRILLDGRKPEAKAVKTRIVTEVMPSLQEFGCYPPPRALMPRSDSAMVPIDREIIGRLDGIDQRLSRVEGKQDQAISRLDRIERHMERVPATRKEIPLDVKEYGRFVVLTRYNGRCPCCESEGIFSTAGEPMAELRWDHWTSRGKVGAEDVWPVCDGCNVELGEPGHTKVRERHRPMFESYQKRREVLAQSVPRPKSHPGQRSLFEETA